MRRRLKRVLIKCIVAAAACVLCALAVGLCANLAIKRSAEGAICRKPEDVPERPVAIIFGAKVGSQTYALERGVPPEDIFLDHAGFRTYATLYRARDVFGVTSAVLITNEFHLPRAIYTGKRFGLDVVGLTSDARTYRTWLFNDCREFLARTLAWMQINITRPRPKYLGPRIDITGDGRVTHDKP